MSARVYKYDIGDRVNFHVNPETTLGTITGRAAVNGSPFYRVRWDDGFREEPSEINANLWDEDHLSEWPS